MTCHPCHCHLPPPLAIAAPRVLRRTPLAPAKLPLPEHLLLRYPRAHRHSLATRERVLQLDDLLLARQHIARVRVADVALETPRRTRSLRGLYHVRLVDPTRVRVHDLLLPLARPETTNGSSTVRPRSYPHHPPPG